ncbi:MAG: N-acyl homoserine lactonase family protein [Solirubrobacterales bacterium]|nr:N-acyl homoserine lactonase family protein [Solirubrobacterales bacterium]
MSVRAEPRPLEFPLPGGSEGATVTVEPMVCGHFNTPKVIQASPSGEVGVFKLLRSTGDDDRSSSPIPAFLIRHPGYGPILVDTGLHPSVSSDPVANLGRFGNWFYRPTLDTGEGVSAQLRGKGIDPASIRLVILTHLHADHASGIADFPDATLVVSAAEWEAATKGSLPAFRGYHRPQFDYAFDFRTASFDGDNVHSYSTFGRTIDLFGDGSVRLAYTPGHSVGHQSVIVRLKDRDMAIAGDAMYRIEQLEDGATGPGVMADAHNYRRSLQEFRLFHRQYPEAVITAGHDPEFYENAPEKWE